MSIKRIDSLDWQRGLLALSIMVYHLNIWELSLPDSSSLLGRLGVYGVTMFFILSGLSMALVYNNISDTRTSINFFMRRIFRIWPLLWVAVITVTISKYLLGKDPEWTIVALNLTTIFGFVSPGSYLNTGAWSIGNEMVYYAFTPIIIYAYNKKLIYGNILTFVTLLIGVFFAINLLTTEKSLTEQWGIYINPFNNLFLYCSGVAIYYNLSRLVLNKRATAVCFLVSLSILAFYPAQGDQINIVTNWERFIFCFASLLLVFSFYKNPFVLPGWVSVALTQVGISTYGIYLLHPIIHQIISFFLKILGVKLEAYLIILLSIVFTIISSWVSYKTFEAPFIKLGKRLTPRNLTVIST